MEQVNVFSTLKKINQRFGLDFLSNDEYPRWIKIKNGWVKISAILLIIMVSMASTKTFSNNDNMNLILNLVYLFIILEALLNAVLLWKRRDKVEDLERWCNQIETSRIPTLTKPSDWCVKVQKRTITTIK